MHLRREYPDGQLGGLEIRTRCEGKDVKLVIYGLPRLHFAAKDIGCLVDDGQHLRGAAETVGGEQARPAAVELPDGLSDGHAVRLDGGRLVRGRRVSPEINHSNIDGLDQGQ